jgi:hypothetical protein
LLLRFAAGYSQYALKQRQCQRAWLRICWGFKEIKLPDGVRLTQNALNYDAQRRNAAR